MDQALLTALAIKLAALAGCTPSDAASWIGSQLAEHSGHDVLGWLSYLMDPAKASKVRDWFQWLGATLARKVRQPIPPRAAPPAKPTIPPPPTPEKTRPDMTREEMAAERDKLQAMKHRRPWQQKLLEDYDHQLALEETAS